MLKQIFTIAIIVFPLFYFWVFWINPVTIKTILLKKGYGMDYIKNHLRKYYSSFYGWIPKLLLK